MSKFLKLKEQEMMDINGGDLSDIPGAIVDAFNGLGQALKDDNFQQAFKGTMKITGGGVGIIANPTGFMRGERSANSFVSGWQDIREAAGY